MVEPTLLSRYPLLLEEGGAAVYFQMNKIEKIYVLLAGTPHS
jgi:hypothetical protein